jgi:hypothetical protein
LSAASKARCAAGFNFTCSKSSLIRSSAVISLVASSSDDRAKNRNASKHVSRLITDLTFYPSTPAASWAFLKAVDLAPRRATKSEK